MQQRRSVLRTVAAGALAFSAGLAGAQQYPSKQIRIIVPVAPGGAIDNGARILAEKLREAWGQPVVIDNRAGANTAIGTALVGQAAPDGYTLLFASNAHVVLPLIASKLPYDAIKDFVPVGSFAYTPYVLLTNPSLPVNSVQEFITYVKARPGQLNFGSSGVGAGSHIAGEVFRAMTGLNMLHVPYKGGGPAMAELLGGRIQANFNSVNSSEAQVKAGKLKALAITSERRWHSLPDVPTFAEAGLPQYQERGWLGLFAPAGTPRAIIDKLNAEMLKILRAPGTKESFETQGLVSLPSTPEQFAEMLRKETTTLAPIVKSANIRME